jgi:hypothetical protein
VIARLVRKDLLLNGNMLAWLAGGLVMMVVLIRLVGRSVGEQMSPMPFGLILFFGSFYGSLLPLMVAARADRFRTGGFDASLPVTRRQLLAARYLLPLLLLPEWVALICGIIWALSGWRLPPEALHAETLLLAPTALVITMGVFFPAVMRLGFVGLLYGAVGLQVVGLVFLVTVRSVPGVRGVFDAITRIGPSLRRLHAGIGDPWYALLVIAVLIGVTLLSFLAADALYRGRDL